MLLEFRAVEDSLVRRTISKARFAGMEASFVDHVSPGVIYGTDSMNESRLSQSRH